MFKSKQFFTQLVGIIGAITCLIIFAMRPSFPTPDKLFIFLFFVFMVFREGLALAGRLLPFISVVLVYESFRGITSHLHQRVNYTFMPHFDQWLFGSLPTERLQQWLWRGHVSWYDFLFYLAYMAHFIMPLGLAILVWKTRDSHYWRVINTYIITAFAAFITFALFPAAPPWLAVQNHVITPIHRISSDVWASLGLVDFPSFYNHITPNLVAAVPSLHAAWATLFLIFVYKLYGWRWALAAGVYPLLIYVGTVYQGEHYVFDEIAGIFYAIVIYLATPRLMHLAKLAWAKAKASYSSSTRSASKSAKQ